MEIGNIIINYIHFKILQYSVERLFLIDNKFKYVILNDHM